MRMLVSDRAMRLVVLRFVGVLFLFLIDTGSDDEMATVSTGLWGLYWQIMGVVYRGLFFWQSGHFLRRGRICTTARSPAVRILHVR